jgi:hypothetical protein
MSSFECKVSELNNNSDSNVLKDDKKNNVSSSGVTNLGFETNTIPIKTTQSNSSNSSNSTDKFLNEKNLKTVLLIAVVYFLLHSELVLEFVNVRIPSLGSNMSLNSAGKIIFGLLIGIFFIVYSFFFQGP